MNLNQEQLEAMRTLFPVGTRIRCLEYQNGFRIPTGEEGSLEHISAEGLFHCNLKDGRRFIADIDEGCFEVILPELPEPCCMEQCQVLINSSRDVSKCGEAEYDLRLAMLGVLDVSKMPVWANNIFFPPIRSIVALPGKDARVVDVSPLKNAICQQLHCENLDRIGESSAKEGVNIYFDADAEKKGLPFNRKLYGLHYYGPILINGMYAEDRPLTDVETKGLLWRLNAPEAMREPPKRTAKGRKKGGEAR